MYARVATCQSDPANVDDLIAVVRDMDPGPAERRLSVEHFEVPIKTATGS